MLGGDFEAAWRESDAMRAPRRARSTSLLAWARTFAASGLILRCLHGFGDAVQMLRYVPRLLRASVSS